MSLFKTIAISSAAALACAIGVAAPASAAPVTPNANKPAAAQNGVEASPAYHRGYYHDYYYSRPYWRGYRYGYSYGPRCHWSRYWHRTVCR